MKRHHVVGIIAGICAIGLSMRSAISANIIGAVVSFSLLSGIAISTFFKDRLSPRWSQEIIPFWMFVIVVSLLFLQLFVLDHLP